MSDLGRILVAFGLLLVAAGAVLLLLGRLHLPLGRLPGDLTWKGSNWSVSLPLMSSMIVSLVLSLILWIINHFRH
ncbi:MAG: DUF2905 domain-containing protein [Edaphobacter sp.]|uniref:DUF2905 domain-containing protein n=1 Tax=Edaphobacter sp. TaxID=1934404 RepID=UPI0023A2C1C9|nr:DUF2905 domain-containing protein [Edaphobacter sp.]MDE1176473.1 DUF2905 domain-containing protein [Edaphobacter sp.]